MINTSIFDVLLDLEFSDVASASIYQGARGSNAGDQYHELWALQQVLSLLRPGTDLTAVGVEGISTETHNTGDDDPSWDSADCTLYYGGVSLETADRIEIVQLKYSAANPENAWTIYRLTNSTGDKVNNSVFRKLANDFIDAKSRLKNDAKLKIKFVSNQSLSPIVQRAHDSQRSGALGTTEVDPEIEVNLRKLFDAAGLAEEDFKQFLSALDFSECGADSRFGLKDKIMSTVINHMGDDIAAEVSVLLDSVRNLVMPEGAGKVVTIKGILAWLGVGDIESLFPCRAYIQIPELTIERPAAAEVVSLLENEDRVILVHGEGGCGKTTLLHQVINGLPKGSAGVFFDCFGGGRYIHSDDKRHLPKNAFLHLTNVVGAELNLPIFIPRSGKNPATVRSFMRRLAVAGKALQKKSANAILLIVIDAADNSVAAANRSNPSEITFIHELFDANLADLPGNIRIVASCRSDEDRRDSLKLPRFVTEVICPPFTRSETRQNLEVNSIPLEGDQLAQLQRLSGGNPRVQDYAIKAAGGDKKLLLDALLPRGKSLNEVLTGLFDIALKKLGHDHKFEEIVGLLAYLPAPVPISALARIADCSKDIIRNFALDLRAGLRIEDVDSTLTLADEDFEVLHRN